MMKKVVLIFCCAFCSMCYAQDNTEFKTFVELFPQRNYPLSLFYDDNSVWEIHRPSIPDTLYEKYVFQKESFLIKENEKICFSGFWAKGQFSVYKPFHLLLVAKIAFESGCGEENWLVTYTPQGEIIDVLFIYGRKTNYDNDDKEPHFIVESVITADSITVKRRETIDALIRVDERTTKSTFNAFYMVYRISEEGKFILVSEEVKYEERFWRR